MFLHLLIGKENVDQLMFAVVFSRYGVLCGDVKPVVAQGNQSAIVSTTDSRFDFHSTQ